MRWPYDWLMLAMVLVAVLLLTFASKSEEMHSHPPQDMALHEKFYSHWNRPDMRDEKGARHSSCCNNQDCFPTQFKREGSQWFALNRERAHWVKVPADKMEQNYPDAEDSPDGQGHVCLFSSKMEGDSWSDTVFCAVLGSGM